MHKKRPQRPRRRVARLLDSHISRRESTLRFTVTVTRAIAKVAGSAEVARLHQQDQDLPGAATRVVVQATQKVATAAEVASEDADAVDEMTAVVEAEEVVGVALQASQQKATRNLLGSPSLPKQRRNLDCGIALLKQS